MMPVSHTTNIARTQSSIADIPRAVMNVALRDDCLNLCHLNAQSLCARQLSKLDEFKRCFANSKVDLICVTETWLNENITDSTVAVEGYSILRNDRMTGRGGGICIYYKSGLNCRVLDNSDMLSGHASVDRTEHLFIEVRVSEDKLLLGVIYSPPDVDCSYLIDQKLSELSLDYEKIVLIGDFNTNLRKNCPKTTRFCEVLDNFGMFCVNTEPTHFYPGGSSLIDLLITNDINFVLNFNQVSAPTFSHHDIIFSSLNVLRYRNDNPRMIRDYSRIDYPSLQHYLNGIDWSLLYSITDSDTALDFFNSVIIQLFDNLVPLRAPRHKNNAPWFNNDILNAMIARDVAYREWIRSKNLLYHHQFKRLRNKVTQLINTAKSNYMSSNLESAISSKELWVKLKRLNVTGSSNSSAKFHHSKDEINTFFGENFTRDSTHPSIPPSNSSGFTFTPCSELEVANSIFSISSDAIGLDGIPLKFIKII